MTRQGSSSLQLPHMGCLSERQVSMVQESLVQGSKVPASMVPGSMEHPSHSPSLALDARGNYSPRTSPPGQRSTENKGRWGRARPFIMMQRCITTVAFF